MNWSARVIICVLLAPGLAHADRALMLPPRSEQTLSTSELIELVDALESALRGHGVTLATGAAPGGCSDETCVAGLVGEAEATHAVELTVWRAAGGEVSGVSVSLLRPSGERYSEGAQRAFGEHVAYAVKRAAAGAYARMRRGPGPWLELAGGPAGAAITIDGQAAGTVPRTVRVAGGLHRVLVSHPGFEPFDETVTVPRNPDALKQVSVVLRPSSGLANARDDGDTTPAGSPSALNYAIAAGAAATAVLLAIGPIRSAARDGECGRMEAGRCTGVIEFGTGQAVQLTAAALVFAGGATFAVWAPLRTRQDSVTGVALSGTF